jgi:hypothetical protein
MRVADPLQKSHFTAPIKCSNTFARSRAVIFSVLRLADAGTLGKRIRKMDARLSSAQFVAASEPDSLLNAVAIHVTRINVTSLLLHDQWQG